MSPDQFGLDGFKKRFNSGVVMPISLAAHRYVEAMLPQDLLAIVRAILATTIRVVDAALGWHIKPKQS